MLFFTGTRRVASDIAEEQIRQTPNRKLELSEMLKLVDEAARVLQGTRNIADIGQMLHETWMLKRSLTHKISNSIIDDIYNSARRLGAIGGKLLGAGGGGFILFFVSPEDRQHVEERLGLLHVPFGFEFRGSHIIFFDPMTETRFSPRVVGREVENFEANAIRKRAYENK
jgi:D-glycero-alpha-D-manno-heptose-7-phosphate kinase